MTIKILMVQTITHWEREYDMIKIFQIWSAVIGVHIKEAKLKRI